MKIDYKRLFISILIPLLLGTIVGLITNSGYKDMIQPSFSPPGIIFPIVWGILYILMGISNYLVPNNKYYYPQLIINLLWSFIFFTFKLYLLAFLWIIVLIVFVILMIKEYYKSNRLSAIIQIPYLLWLIFAAILCYATFKLN